MQKPASLALLLLAASLIPQAAAQTPFCDTLRTEIEASPAHWGISVTTLDGTPLCPIHDAQLFRPASTAKLFTVSAALALLGPGYTTQTRVTGQLDPATETVQGDLTLVGAGDANLDSDDLPYAPGPHLHRPLSFPDLDDLAAQLAGQLASRSIKSVTGDIVGDDTLFPRQPYAFGVEWNDLPLGFGAPVSALTLHDNELLLSFAPGQIVSPARSAPAQLSINQHELPYYTLVNDVTTVPAGSALARGLAIDRLPGSRTLRVYGRNASDSKAGTGTVSIDDPALFAAMALRQALLAHGIAVTGTARAAHREPQDAGDFLAQLRAPVTLEQSLVEGKLVGIADCPVHDSPASQAPALATHVSPTLADDVHFTLKESQNLHAELILHALARKVPCADGSTLAGARLVRAFTLHAGIPDTDLTLYDGSGLSGHDLVTPRALTRLLIYDAAQPWFPIFKAALPVGGVDGTLASRFTGPSPSPAHTELKGKVFAKTGTLGETRALAGFLTTASGQTLVFSLLDDNHPPSSVDDRILQEKILAQIAAAN